MKKKNFIISILLSLVMVFTCVPCAMQAEAATQTEIYNANKAYKTLLAGSSDLEEFALYDLNNDGIHELITHGGGAINYSRIYTYKGGASAKEVHFGTWFDIYSNGIVECTFNSGSGYWLDSFYRMNGNLELSLVYRYAEWLDTSPSTYSEGEDAYEEYSERVDYSEVQEHKAQVIGGAAVVKLTYHKNDAANRARYLRTGAAVYPRPTKLTKVKPLKKAMTVKWKKQPAKVGNRRISGYQVQYSTDKTFVKRTKIKTIKGYKKTSVTIKKLKAKKRYYVRVRTYLKKDGITYCSAWSEAKKVKTK